MMKEVKEGRRFGQVLLMIASDRARLAMTQILVVTAKLIFKEFLSWLQESFSWRTLENSSSNLNRLFMLA